MTSTDAAGYKARKEAFVSNLAGSSITEINLVTLVAPAAVFLWTTLQRRQSFFTPFGPLAFAVDFILNVCAILFAFTAYSSVPLFLNIYLVTPALLLLLLLPPKSKQYNGEAKSSTFKGRKSADTSRRTNNQPWRLVSRPFLTHYRGAMMISTTVAILAVDFPVFPRRFAKVETWGTSLMDLGVGSFVFSAGVVSSRALFKTDQTGKPPGIATRLLSATKHSIPLIVLGVVRLVSVKGLDYAEHVTEYGVHWNFFFTLALLSPFVEMADTLIQGLFRVHAASYGLLALTISVTYEVVLNNTQLLSYILISSRGPGLLSKNREGVFSFIGYLAIFLTGRGTGSTIVGFSNEEGLKLEAPKHVDDPGLTTRERTHVLRRVATDAVLPLVLYWLSTSIYTFNLTVSRRLANLPYVLWIVAFNQLQIVLFGIAEAYGPSFSYAGRDAEQLRNASSKIMQVFNKNGLIIFLVANLLTGLVNLSINTLDMTSIGAMAILILYAGIVTAVAMGMYYTGIRIKL